MCAWSIKTAVPQRAKCRSGRLRRDSESLHPRISHHRRDSGNDGLVGILVAAHELPRRGIFDALQKPAPAALAYEEDASTSCGSSPRADFRRR